MNQNLKEKKFYQYDENGQIKYLTKQEIKEMWEFQLKEEGNEVELGEFEILSSTDEKTNKKYYFLKISSTDSTFETGAFFEITKNGLLY